MTKKRFFNPSIVNNYHFVNFTSGGLMNKKMTSNELNPKSWTV